MAAWRDYRGAAHQVSDDVLRSVLRVLGSSETKPVGMITADAGGKFRLPAAADGKRVTITEEGEGRTHRLETRPGRTGATATAPETSGYHRVGFGRETLTLAVAPRPTDKPRGKRARADSRERAWGLSAQIYSLYRPGDRGLAGYTALADLIRSAASAGASALAVSPLHAQFSADLSRFSPYSPSSRLWMNVLHVDPDAAAAQLGGRATAYGSGEDTHEPLVDWPAASRQRLDRLRALYRRHRDRLMAAKDDAVARDFARFQREGGEGLLAHAVFETLHQRFFSRDAAQWHWSNWPEAFRRYTPALARQVQREDASEVGFHLFLQWLAARQFRAAAAAAAESGMRLGIIKDIAVGADGGGSEAWSNPEGMLSGASIGAPPDAFNTLGQNWGVTTLSPAGIAANGYSGFIALLRQSLRDAGGIRIDHILGLQRLWVVPDGADPHEGAYVRYPLADLLRIVAIEAERAGAMVLGEDLGTVPEGFREHLAEHAIRGMQVLWFERAGTQFQEPEAWRPNAVAMTTTHDLPTIAGWWMAKDVAWRKRLKLFPSPRVAEQARADRERDRPRLWRAFKQAGLVRGPVPPPNQTTKVVKAAISYLGRTACDLALLPLEDAFARKEQPNLPGTVNQHPNWRRRILVPAAELCQQKRVRKRLALLAAGRQES
jgi:4-alpha-glucanotransferase